MDDTPVGAQKHMATPADVSALLVPCIGAVDVQKVSGKINYKPNVDVRHLRIWAEDPRIKDTVILKALLPQALDIEVELFTRERANHDFLTRCGFDQKPAVYGHGATVMVLEDLGIERREFADIPSAETAVATLLARLHSGSIGLEADYQNTLKSYGIAENSDMSVILKPSVRQGWAVAAHILAEIGQNPDRFNQAIEGFLDGEQAPDWARGFIHDDFAQGRQAVITDTGLYLVDFERSRFGNIFVDPARIMLGEACSKGNDDAILVSLNFSPEFLAMYLAQLESNLASPLPEGFEEEFGRVAILLALQLIGDCVDLAETGRFVAPMHNAIASICTRLRVVLDYLSAQQDLAQDILAIVAATEDA